MATVTIKAARAAHPLAAAVLRQLGGGRDIAAALWGGPPESEDGLRLVSNALAWFALEEVGHALANLTA